MNGVYMVTKDRTLEDLKFFRNFLYRNFKKYEHCEKMMLLSNQQGTTVWKYLQTVCKHCTR